MMTARDAALLTFETYNAVHDNEDDVRRKIYKAAKKGKTEIFLFDIEPGILKHFEEYGFDVDYTKLTISWETEIEQVEILSISGSLNTGVP